MIGFRTALVCLVLAMYAACGGQPPPTNSVPDVPLAQTPLPEINLVVADVGATSAKIVAVSSQDGYMRVRLGDSTDGYRSSGFVRAHEPYVETFNMLTPEQSYVVTVEAANQLGSAVYAFASFKTGAAIPGAALFRSVETVFRAETTGFVQVTSYTLSAPARVYLFEKYAFGDPWSNVSFTNQKYRAADFSVGVFPPETKVFFRLVAQNDDGVTTDSYEGIFLTPLK